MFHKNKKILQQCMYGDGHAQSVLYPGNSIWLTGSIAENMSHYVIDRVIVIIVLFYWNAYLINNGLSFSYCFELTNLLRYESGDKYTANFIFWTYTLWNPILHLGARFLGNMV